MNLRHKVYLLVLLLILCSSNHIHAQSAQMKKHLENAEQYIRNGDCENAKKEYDKYVNLNRRQFVTYYKDRAKQVSWNIDKCFEEKKRAKQIEIPPKKQSNSQNNAQSQNPQRNNKLTKEETKEPTNKPTAVHNKGNESANHNTVSKHVDSDYNAENQKIENFNKFKSAGDSLFQQEQFLAAKEAYQNAMMYASGSNDDTFIAKQMDRCECHYSSMKGDSLYSQKKYKAAIDHYNRVLSYNDPDIINFRVEEKMLECSYYYNLELGDMSFKDADYLSAKSYYEYASKIDFWGKNDNECKERFYKVNFHLGEEYLKQYKFSDALSSYLACTNHPILIDSVLLSRIKFCKDRYSCTVAEIRDNESGTGDRINKIKDHEGNEYGVVQIGKQCWMSQDLRTKTHPKYGSNLDFMSYNSILLYKDPTPRSSVNTKAGIDVQGICPKGWHLPSREEYLEFIDFVFVKKSYNFYCDTTKNIWCAMKSLVSEEGWKKEEGKLAFGNEPLTNNASGFSALPTRGQNYALYFMNDGRIIEIGIAGVSAINVQLNSAIRCIRNEKEYSISDCGTVNDYDGNTYKTTRIGKQCWMAENLRTNRYADGKKISKDHNNAIYSSDKQKYGRRYSWSQMIGKETPSDNNPSGVQGICPSGWHIPSRAEWEQLQTYVKDNISTSPYVYMTSGLYKTPAEENLTGFKSYEDMKYWSCSEQKKMRYAFYVRKSGVYTTSYWHSEAPDMFIRCILDE